MVQNGSQGKWNQIQTNTWLGGEAISENTGERMPRKTLGSFRSSIWESLQTSLAASLNKLNLHHLLFENASNGDM